MAEQPACSYEFGLYRVDPNKRVLWRGTEVIPLGSRAFDTLLIFVQNSGRTIEKEELIDRVWGSTIVEENNLTQCISALRKALGESRGDNRFIITLPGRGYRFVAEVKEKQAESPAAPLLKSPAPQGAESAIPAAQAKISNGVSRSPRFPKRAVAAGLWLAAAGAVVLGLLLAKGFWSAKSAGSTDQAPAGGHSTTPGVNREAYEAYLRGVYFLNRRDVGDIEKGEVNFREAIAGGPRFALAYAGLSESYTLLALDGADPQETGAAAKAAALKAVVIDNSSAESHTALGAAKALFDWDWNGAGREFARANSLNPRYNLAHQWNAAFCLEPQGRYDEAIAEMKLAQNLDPLSLIVNTDLGWAYFIAGRYNDAFGQYEKTVDLDRRFVPAHYRLVQYYLAKGMYAEAVREMEFDLRYSGHPDAAAEVDLEYRSGGYRQVCLSRLQSELAAPSRTFAGASFDVAELYALLGRKQEALRVLSALCDRHDPSLIYLKTDPIFASLRQDEKFRSIERRMGLNP